MMAGCLVEVEGFLAGWELRVELWRRMKIDDCMGMSMGIGMENWSVRMGLFPVLGFKA